ncbi:DUF397 domain-containing protein [Actinoalloteichus hymeniacidonis]|uniref:DUF397 domain-containing protein n=1 Tax=Actinoalloteichus hymeniacidonis TaxID=340345 RepID=UPI000A055B91|nr:DUF397 domain-containing protein [Actinoalloteichus hymeniacidonis]
MKPLRAWKKSSRSAVQTSCVEVGWAPGVVGIRDTKNRDSGTLLLDRPAFTSFLAAVKADRIR